MELAVSRAEQTQEDLQHRMFTYNEKHPVHVIWWRGRNWWIAQEICDVLEIKQASRAVKDLDYDADYVKVTEASDLKSLANLLGLSPMTRHIILLTESGLYGLIMQSRKPEARIFQAWVRQIVLPALSPIGLKKPADPSNGQLLDVIELMVRQMRGQQQAIHNLNTRLDNAATRFKTLETRVNTADTLKLGGTLRQQIVEAINHYVSKSGKPYNEAYKLFYREVAKFLNTNLGYHRKKYFGNRKVSLLDVMEKLDETGFKGGHFMKEGRRIALKMVDEILKRNN
jgi:prophage antirepressor-like protein